VRPDGLDTTVLVASILNQAWLVRHYHRGARSSIGRLERKQAIQRLGLTIREAFNKSDDFEPLLIAVVDGLRPKDDPPF
jgi:hypothetical protein